VNHLKGRTVVVTGAGRGFGELISIKAADYGAAVVACDIDGPLVTAVAEGITKTGRQALAIQADVTDLGAMQAVIEQAVAAFGSVDVIVNNAGVMPLAFFVSSIYGNYPAAGAGVYGATKAAVVFMSEALRIESQGRIKVTTIRPTGVPATGLDEGIINPEAEKGILGPDAVAYIAKFKAAEAGTLSADEIDPQNIRYWALDPDALAEQVIYAINQPWGVCISDVTVRASGDGYVI